MNSPVETYVSTSWNYPLNFITTFPKTSILGTITNNDLFETCITYNLKQTAKQIALSIQIKRNEKKRKTPRNYSYPRCVEYKSAGTKFQRRREPRRWPADLTQGGPRHGVLATRQLYKPLYRSLLVRSGPHINRWHGYEDRIYCEPGRKTYSDRLSRGSRVAVKSALEHLLGPPRSVTLPSMPLFLGFLLKFLESRTLRVTDEF